METISDCFCLTPMMIMHKKAYMIPDDRRNFISSYLKEPFTKEAISQLLLFKRECFENVGYFDEGFSFGECSDDDYYLRIYKYAKKIYLTHKSLIFHGERTTRTNVPDSLNFINKSKEYFLKKWGPINVTSLDTKILKFVRADNEEWKVWGAK